MHRRVKQKKRMNSIKIGMLVCKEWKAGYCRNKSKEEKPWKTEKKFEKPEQAIA
jgi:hypothetical protein